MTKIFVNFRREDVPADARRIRDGLAARFGRSDVVMDIDGAVPEQQLGRDQGITLGGYDAMIAIIGPRWMELLRAHAASGERDYVREQISAALQRGMAVIPVRVGREGSMPPSLRPEDLPEDIRALASRPSRDVAYERFGSDMASLAESISRPRGGAAVALQPGNSTVKLWLWSLAAAASTVLVGNIAVLFSSPAAPPSFAPPASSPRQTAFIPSVSVEGRIRRAMAAATAAGQRADEARRCQAALIAATDAGTIVFNTASAELDFRSHQTLDALAQIVKGCPDFVVEVEGHTDSMGDPNANQRLSERRANSVRSYLVGTGVPATSLAAMGYGETRPIAPNDTPTNMARNRRIEFNVTVK